MLHAFALTSEMVSSRLRTLNGRPLSLKLLSRDFKDPCVYRKQCALRKTVTYRLLQQHSFLSPTFLNNPSQNFFNANQADRIKRLASCTSTTERSIYSVHNFLIKVATAAQRSVPDFLSFQHIIVYLICPFQLLGFFT